MTSHIALYTDQVKIDTLTQSRTAIRFKKKVVTYVNGFSDGGIVRYGRLDEYGTVKIRSTKVTVIWDDGDCQIYSAFYDEETQTQYSALEIAQECGCIKPVPWFIAGQTIVVIPRPDGSIALPECEYQVVSVDDKWIEIRQISGDHVDRYAIGEMPGFPFRTDVLIKERPLLPIPPRYKLKHIAGKHYLWSKENLADLISQKDRLYAVFRKEQSSLSNSEEDFIWAWQEEWNWCVKRLARDRGHGGKKIGTQLFIQGAIETLIDFDTERFEFVTDKDRRIPLLQLYLHPELAIEKLGNNVFVLTAGEYIEARVGFNNKNKAQKRETLIKRLFGCKNPTLIAGEFTGCTHEWVLANSFKRINTFMRHLIDLVSLLPR